MAVLSLRAIKIPPRVIYLSLLLLRARKEHVFIAARTLQIRLTQDLRVRSESSQQRGRVNVFDEVRIARALA